MIWEMWMYRRTFLYIDKSNISIEEGKEYGR